MELLRLDRERLFYMRLRELGIEAAHGIIARTNHKLKEPLNPSQQQIEVLGNELVRYTHALKEHKATIHFDTEAARVFIRFAERALAAMKDDSKLTAKPFSQKDLKQRVKMAGQRRTIGYFLERKFNVPEVIETLRHYGFSDDYGKVIVSWGWAEEAARQAEKADVMLWDFREIIREIGERFKETRTYFADDTLRTLQLFAKAMEGTQ